MYNHEMSRGCYNPSISTFHKELLNLLIEAMKGEKADFIRYKMMIDAASDEKVREQIKFAYLDEGKHYKMFQQIYYKLSGEVINVPAPKVNLSESFIGNIEDSINGELQAVELYRKIRSMLPSTMCRDALYEIITDEQEHAARFTYIYAIKK